MLAHTQTGYLLLVVFFSAGAVDRLNMQRDSDTVYSECNLDLEKCGNHLDEITHYSVFSTNTENTDEQRIY